MDILDHLRFGIISTIHDCVIDSKPHWCDSLSPLLALFVLSLFFFSLSLCLYLSLLVFRYEAEALFAINECLSGLYHEGLFIRSPRANYLATQGLTFLRKYAKLALWCFEARKRRFPFMPKGHYLHHQFLSMLQQSQRGEWVMNILAFANQQSEDFVGRPSRLSRRVSSRTTSLRVIQRAFLAIRAIVIDGSG